MDAADVDLSASIVDALNAVNGVHPGFRAVHANGVCAQAVFTATPEAAALSVAAHLQGDDVPAVVRFSNGSGNPALPDHAPDGRGIAVKLRLADGSSTDLVGLSAPVFFVRTPTDFLALLGAMASGDPAQLGAFVAAHPETAARLSFAAQAPLPSSYATTPFFGVHTFFAEAPDGTRRAFRYRWEPDEAAAAVVAGGLADDYLRAELPARLAGATAGFSLRWTFAEPGDRLDDPTVAWPADRPSVRVGHLTLTGAVADHAGGCEDLIFDPTRVLAGIECSDDPILHARSGAYGVSYARRHAVR